MPRAYDTALRCCHMRASYLDVIRQARSAMSYALGIMREAYTPMALRQAHGAKSEARSAERPPTDPIALLPWSCYVAAQKFFKNLKEPYSRSRVWLAD